MQTIRSRNKEKQYNKLEQLLDTKLARAIRQGGARSRICQTTGKDLEYLDRSLQQVFTESVVLLESTLFSDADN